MQSDPTEMYAPDYELGVLDFLILEQINPANSNSTISIEFLNSLEAKAASEVKLLRYKMASKTFETLQEDRTRVLIKNYQRQLRNHINELNSYIDIMLTRKEPQVVEIYYKIQTHILSLLLLLSKEYDDFFDFSAKADVAFKKKYVDLAINCLKEYQLDTYDDHSTVLSIVLEPLLNFISTYKQEPFTYHYILYLCDFVEHISSLDQKLESFDKELEIIMMKYNFNSSRYFNYKIEQIQIQLSDRETIKERLEYLSSYQKDLRQMEIFPNRKLYADQRSIHDQISSWITEEFEFVHNKLISSQLRITDEVKPDEKIQVHLSVPQLALFFRLLIETGIIENKKLATVIKTITKSFKTKHSEQISSESFRTKYYEIETKSVETIKDALIKMINILSKMN